MIYRLDTFLGEDDVSFERHNNFLRKEHSKLRPNSQVVKDLMSTIFPMRRADILANVQTLFKKYPFLNDVGQVCNANDLYLVNVCMSAKLCLYITIGYGGYEYDSG